MSLEINLIEILGIAALWITIGVVIGAGHVAGKEVPESVKAEFIGRSAVRWPIILAVMAAMYLVDFVEAGEDDRF